MRRVGVYCRISDDRSGQGLGVARQREDCTALAQRKRWSVADVFVDNDLSAYSGKRRPAYERLLDALNTGAIDAVIAWHPDRLHRSPTELEQFIAVVESRGAAVETVQAGAWDLSTPSGRLIARQLGNVARYESEHKSERVRRALAENARDGKAHGRRAFGWRRETVDGRTADVVDEAEAASVREIARRILAGDSLRSITSDLNAVSKTPSGAAWSKQAVRALVLRERNVGLRVHHGQVIGRGCWTPILDDGTYEQVRAVLADPSRRTSTSTAAVHLLSGIARCGNCGAAMRAAKNRTVYSYRCAARSCVSRNRRDVDELVTTLVLGRLARPDAVDLIAPPDTSEVRHEAEAKVAELEARLDNAADSYAEGKINLRSLERLTATLEPQLQAARSCAIAVVDASPLLDGLVGNDRADAVWESLSLSRRRAVIDLLVGVVVRRSSQGARTFRPEDVEITWK